jgi:hypothetical protein
MDPNNPDPMADFKFLRTYNWGNTTILMEAEVAGAIYGIVVELNNDNCHPSCKYCTKPNDLLTCLECTDTSKNLLKGRCVDSCTPGFNTRTDGSCQKCPDTRVFKHCASCSLPASFIKSYTNPFGYVCDTCEADSSLVDGICECLPGFNESFD